jgi:RND family efflux transporter MFP subunit
MVISATAKPPTVGDRVQKGAPIAILEHRYNLHDAAHISNARWDLLKVMMEARTVALEARIEREQAERLLAAGSMSAQRVQELKAAELEKKVEYERTRQLLAQQDQQIGNATLVRRPLPSPMDGEISLVNYTQGQMIHEGFLLFRLVNRKQVRVSAHVPESEYQPLPAGATARITFDDVPGRVFQGKLEQTLPSVHPETRTRDVVFLVDNPDEMLRFGMIGHVEVQTP